MLAGYIRIEKYDIHSIESLEFTGIIQKLHVSNFILNCEQSALIKQIMSVICNAFFEFKRYSNVHTKREKIR